MKLHELAKELNVRATELLKTSQLLGLAEIKSINNNVSDEDEQALRNEVGPTVTTGSCITPIAFVRKSGQKDAHGQMIYELCEAEICENGVFVMKKVTPKISRTRAFHDLGYKNGLIEIEV